MDTSRRKLSATGDASSPAMSRLGPGGTKARRARAHLSCEECRRTKSKCDRSWPCSECVRKEVSHLCPNGSVDNGPSKSQTIRMLQERVTTLEAELRRVTSTGRTSMDSGSIMGSQSDSHGALSRHVVESKVQPHEMTAMLDQIALGASSSRRYVGTEASPFYLASPADSDDEAEGSTPKADQQNPFSRAAMDRDSALQVPWADKNSIGVKEMEPRGPLLDKCRALLPTQKETRASFEVYWDLITWRTQPMTRAFFLSKVLPAVYDSPEGPHPHDLAVLFSVLALAYLFGNSALLDPSASSSAASKNSAKAKECHETAYACLVAGRFYTDTTLSSLVTLQNIGTFMLNSDDRRLPDGNFAVFGLAMRLAIIAGYHRDPGIMQRGLALEEMDMRRRVFHEILASDRLHSLPALLPNSVDTSHYDTKLPSDVPPRGYFVFKWRIGVHISRVVDYWTSTTIPPYSALQEIDKNIRILLHSLPFSLRCPHLSADAFPITGSDPTSSPRSSDDHADQAEASSDPSTLAKQQIRLAMHFCMLFFYLHRPHFIRSLVADDAAYQSSVDAIIETCRHVVVLTEAVMNLNWELSRWFSFAGDLFSVLHCQTVLIVKTTDTSQVASWLSLLERGVDILQWTASVRPSSKNRALLQGAKKLIANAKQSRADSSTQGLSPLWQELLNWTNTQSSTFLSTSFGQAAVPVLSSDSSAIMSQDVNWSPWSTSLTENNPGLHIAASGFDRQNDTGFDPFFANLLQMTDQLPVQVSTDGESEKVDAIEFSEYLQSP